MDDMHLRADDARALDEAVELLENANLPVRIAALIGAPVGWSLARLPAPAAEAIRRASEKAVLAALKIAVATVSAESPRPPRYRAHRIAAAAAGAAGGALGLPALAVELPVSTMIMLRSIAEIARAQGEIVTSAEAQVAMVEVFALGGRLPEDDASQAGYYAVRAALAKAVSEAAAWIGHRGFVEESAPAIVRLVAAVAARFGIAVSEKVAAQTIPVIGALGGAAINWLFMDHFQSAAKGHFAVRRLERIYGPDIVRAEYERRATRLKGRRRAVGHHPPLPP
jgi:hypothetical protein